MRRAGARSRAALGAFTLAVALLVAAAAWWSARPDDASEADARGAAGPLVDTPDLVARGRYLALAGNCAGCHTARGGQPYAGGRAIATPFGAVTSANLTPDAATGLGRWTARDFRRALHEGRSKDGRLLYPAFPYPNYSRVTRDDADALFAYLRSLEPVRRPQAAHELRFPFDTQAALAVWRALYFRPRHFEPDARRDAQWNRGAYLVQGLGHCSACHARRNALGATPDPLALDGGSMPAPPWYAPSLASAAEASLAGADADQAMRLLRDGVAAHAGASGPMAQVVRGSTQHLSDADLRAMVVYLQSLAPAAARKAAPAPPAIASAQGSELYDRHCAGCHGEAGEGVPGIYPALAGNRALLHEPPANLVQVVLGGAFPASTAANPRPFGMPPFATTLGDEEVAAVLSYIRNAWGQQAGAVSPLDVQRWRASVRP